MSPDDKRRGRADALRRRLDELERERQAVLAELGRLTTEERQQPSENRSPAATLTITAASSSGAKIALFRSLFRGREDVFPRRWENARTGKSGYAPVCRNEWVRGVCEKPRVKCGECPHQEFVPVSDETVRSHLQGRDLAAPEKQTNYVAGVYPLLPDETCWFLAVDFDKSSWKSDASAFVETCREHDVKEENIMFLQTPSRSNGLFCLAARPPNYRTRNFGLETFRRFVAISRKLVR